MTDQAVLDTLSGIRDELDKIEQQIITETPTNGQKRTHVAFVLDESGSMGMIREQAIDGFNEQVNAVKANASKGGKTTVSQWRFGCPPDAMPKEVYFDQPTDQLMPITEETYTPFGMTPMYDGIGMALTRLKTLDNGGDVAFLVVLVSDGQENASKVWTSEQIAQEIQTLQGTQRWTFVYIGANHDLSQVSKHLGIPQGNMIAFVASPMGTEKISGYVAASTANYMSNRGRGMTYTSAFTGNEGQVTAVNEDGSVTTNGTPTPTPRKKYTSGDQARSS